MERLFVYGSLGPGRPNAHVLEDIGGSWLDASLKGRLLEAGWGAEMGFPGLVLDDQGQEVTGFVFSSDKLQERWPMLDRFEGDGYERVKAQVTLDDGSHLDAWVYVLSNQAG